MFKSIVLLRATKIASVAVDVAPSISWIARTLSGSFMMATTMFFEGPITDKKDKSRSIDLEFGRSSYYGENLIYVTVGDETVILDDKAGRKLVEDMAHLARYLGYDE